MLNGRLSTGRVSKRTAQWDGLVVEASGLADPGALVETFVGGELRDRAMLQHVVPARGAVNLLLKSHAKRFQINQNILQSSRLSLEYYNQHPYIARVFPVRILNSSLSRRVFGFANFVPLSIAWTRLQQFFNFELLVDGSP